MSEEKNQQPKGIFNDITGKLKADSVTLIVGVIFGIPAWGIFAPQVFAVLGTAKSFELSCLFKVFAICYFTLPFVIIFLAVVFQLQDKLFAEMKKTMLFFMGGIAVIIIIILFIHSIDGGQRVFRPVLNPMWAVIIITIALLWRYLFSLKNQINNAISAYESSEKKNEPIDITDEASTPKSEDADKNDPKDPSTSSSLMIISAPPEDKPDSEPAEWEASIIKVNFGILFLFIPIQWVIALLLTANHHLYSSSAFLFGCLLLYMLPFFVYVYWWKRKFKATGNLATERITSNHSIPGALGIFPLVLWATILFGDGYQKATKYMNLGQRERNYFLRFESTKKLTDTIIPEMEFVNRTMEINKLQKENIALSGVTHHIQKDTSWKIWSADLNGLLNQRDSANRLLHRYIDTVMQSGAIDVDSILSKYKTTLDQFAKVQLLIAKEDLLKVTRTTQRTGLLIFVTTMMILVFILSVLFFGDRKYHFSRSNEINKARRILEIVLLLILILMLPLTKAITKEKIQPQDNAGLFKLGNWNISWILNLNSHHTDIDTLININKSACNCCPPPAPPAVINADTVIQTAGAIEIRGMDQLLINLNELVLKMADFGTGEGHVNTDLGSLVKELQGIKIALQDKSTRNVRVENLEKTDLKKVEKTLDVIYNDIRLFRENALTRQEFSEKLLQRFTELQQKLLEVNFKGSLLNQKQTSDQKDGAIQKQNQ